MVRSAGQGQRPGEHVILETSVIIPVLNQWSLTAACLRSLAAHSPDTIEVIVVDNGSGDDTPRSCPDLGERLFPERFRFLRQENNLNFGPASNLGAQHACGEFLYFLNNDTETVSNWHSPLRKAFDDPDLGATGPLLLYPTGQVQHAGIVFTPLMATKHLFEFHPPDHPVVRQPRALQAITAAALMIRAETFHALDGFYPPFRNGSEDIDLCARLLRKGLHLRLCTDVRVIHHTSQSAGRFDHDSSNAALLSARQLDILTPDYHRIVTECSYVFEFTPWLGVQAGLDVRNDVKKRMAFQSSSLEAILEELNREPLWKGGYELAASKTTDPALRTQLCLMESRFFPSINGFDQLATLADQIHNPIILDFARTNLESIKSRLAKPDTLRRQARSVLVKARQQDDQTLIKAVDNWQRPSRNPATFL